MIGLPSFQVSHGITRCKNTIHDEICGTYESAANEAELAKSAKRRGERLGFQIIHAHVRGGPRDRGHSFCHLSLANHETQI
jgi:hypothetical protein